MTITADSSSVYSVQPVVYIPVSKTMFGSACMWNGSPVATAHARSPYHWSCQSKDFLAAVDSHSTMKYDYQLETPSSESVADDADAAYTQESRRCSVKLHWCRISDLGLKIIWKGQNKQNSIKKQLGVWYEYLDQHACTRVRSSWTCIDSIRT